MSPLVLKKLKGHHFSAGTLFGPWLRLGTPGTRPVGEPSPQSPGPSPPGGPLFKLVCRFEWSQSDIRTPVAVLDENRAASLVHQLREHREVAKLPAAIKLDTVEAKVDRGLDLALVVMNPIVASWSDRGAPARNVLVLVAAAIVGVPAHAQADGVRMIGHRLHARELLQVDERVAGGVVERAVGARPARLVVEE